ncbi:MAG TPA: PQQ-dependent sugar dehydrogenase, partial [Thermoanaerobaculia bacterium]|nr:PQQ-dependent sugar dehydrogenase [Thermoanaerobaculia bacterium]
MSRTFVGSTTLAALAFTLPLAATYPAGFVQETVASTIQTPTAFAFAPDGRIFVCEKGGNVRVVKNGTLLGTSFTTFTVDSAGERGLLGVAFDPQFTTNRYVYFYYTATTPAAHNRVVRVTASAVNPDVSDGVAAVTILDLDNLSGATNHNGGAIHFGPDSKLYVVHGENANSANAQTLNNLLGKILRINADGTVPIDNPYYNQAPKRGEIWANGLRNPFTFEFHPTTGRLHINDVGENTWEEVNLGARGVNYGWPNCE